MKLTPNVADPAAVAAAAARGRGADAVSLINTAAGDRARPGDPASPGSAPAAAGSRAPAVRAVALDQVRRVAAAVSIPVIGMGGIETGADALAFLAAGATAVAVGTASFRDPLAGRRGSARSSRRELERAGDSTDRRGGPLASTST